MKRTNRVLAAGCLFGALAVTPFSSHSLLETTVDAAPTLAFVIGTVRDNNGTPVSGALVALLEPQSQGKELKSVKTDPLGNFSVGILPGLYRLRASAEGYKARIAHISLDRSVRSKFDFSLKRTDTLVQKRGDSEDYRWIARSVPRHAMNLKEDEETDVTDDPLAGAEAGAEEAFGGSRRVRPTFHGAVQLIAASSNTPAGADFYGTNFAVSGSLGGNFEMAFIGQRGVGQLAPQRLSAIASMRPGANHQITAAVGYAQIALMRGMYSGQSAARTGLGFARNNSAMIDAPAHQADSIEQVSVSTVASWQALRPLLVIYGFDYSSFVGANRDSLLPRFAVQYAPTARTRINAAVTPGAAQQATSPETFNTENLQASFDLAPQPIAFGDSPMLDRSQRFELGAERLFGEGETSIGASAFYDLISGHGVGILALPLEASPETQATIQQVAHQVTAMNGAARGVRVMLKHRINNHASASAGYSYGYGSQFNNEPIQTLTPDKLFRSGFFQVASAKLDLDFTEKTGTRISTVIRLSPDAVVFAIDPFAGQMGVYDPNINIYIAQDLPNFGLPVRWQAIVDIRNLLDQNKGVEDGALQLAAAAARRSVRGGLAFRW
jgi:hypothetical protein